MSAKNAALFGFASLVGLAGCAPPRTAETAMPVIQVRPGAAERIALMDRYRLHDEERKLMMARPHVWVEEASEDDDTSGELRDEEPAAPEATNEQKPTP